jgi:hypothetical protein
MQQRNHQKWPLHDCREVFIIDKSEREQPDMSARVQSREKKKQTGHVQSYLQAKEGQGEEQERKVRIGGYKEDVQRGWKP